MPFFDGMSEESFVISGWRLNLSDLSCFMLVRSGLERPAPAPKNFHVQRDGRARPMTDGKQGAGRRERTKRSVSILLSVGSLS